MLDKNKFIKGLTYLKAAYNKFDFDLTDKTKLSIWYGVVEHLSNDQFTNLINLYTRTEKFPPQSPAELLSYYKKVAAKEIEESHLSPDEAFEKFRELNGKHGGLYYNGDRVIKAIEEEYPMIAKVVKEMQYELATFRTDDFVTPKKFKDHYKALLEKEKEKQLLLIDNSGDKVKQLVSGNSNQKLLG